MFVTDTSHACNIVSLGTLIPFPYDAKGTLTNWYCLSCEML